ncbi:hypothetical protein FSP39_018066 [Pinctada imbricata]|uniref:Uncharacterized protein n=1 Tax=Pinctada imbricata TaxID=66713 RepID=A0AA89BT91_PINIB|nr:hypothetical protein FSP39_018066 [Pinctada imbricata]
MFAVLILCLVAAVYSQDPLPCTSPPMWEARELRIDRQENFEEYRRIAYDETNQRERLRDEVDINNTRSYYDILVLWKEKKVYAVDLKTKKCNVTATDRPFRPRGVHPDAKIAGEFVIGPPSIPNEHITIEMFTANYTDGCESYILEYLLCHNIKMEYL